MRADDVKTLGAADVLSNSFPCPVEGANWWKLVKATGNVRLVLTVADTSAKGGKGNIDITRPAPVSAMDKGIVSYQISSDVANDVVTVSFADEPEYSTGFSDQPPQLVSVRVEGFIPGGQQVATLTDLGNPINTGMVKFNNDGTFTPYSLQTFDGQSLLVQEIDSETVFLFTVDDSAAVTFDTKQWGTLRLSFDPNGAANLTLKDAFDTSLVAYKDDGSVVYAGSIPAAFPAGRAVIVPVVASQQLRMQADAAGAAWGVRVVASPRVFVPMKNF